MMGFKRGEKKGGRKQAGTRKMQGILAFTIERAILEGPKQDYQERNDTTNLIRKGEIRKGA